MVLFLCCALAAACGKPYWVSIGDSELEFENAMQSCVLSLSTSRDPKHRAAARSGRSSVHIGHPDDPFAAERELRKCMKSFGYERVVLTDEQYEAIIEGQKAHKAVPADEGAAR